MGIEDRDWYRNDYKRKTGNESNVLTTVVNETENRQRNSSLKTAVIWIAVVAVLYAIFTLASHLTH